MHISGCTYTQRNIKRNEMFTKYEQCTRQKHICLKIKMYFSPIVFIFLFNGLNTILWPSVATCRRGEITASIAKFNVQFPWNVSLVKARNATDKVLFQGVAQLQIWSVQSTFKTCHGRFLIFEGKLGVQVGELKMWVNYLKPKIAFGQE